jgi:hypothetical protein
MEGRERLAADLRSVLPRTQKQWIKRLLAEGWSESRGGRHQVKMTKPGRRPITLPENRRRAYSKGFEAQLERELRYQPRSGLNGREI